MLSSFRCDGKNSISILLVLTNHGIIRLFLRIHPSSATVLQCDTCENDHASWHGAEGYRVSMLRIQDVLQFYSKGLLQKISKAKPF